ncbi:MAG TPA: nuclear transport factor 2 family protein [Xanthobacteraceae bacterium]|nr:nuclear transport factor 2 family protein [Xanthobacteraceae bacterium]
MTDQAEMREFVRIFCEALTSRDASKLRPMLTDDVEWAIYGPIDYFPFFGTRRGKDAVIEAMCNEIAAYLHPQRCESERMLFDGDSAAALVRMTASHVPSGRVISFRLAQFIKFKDGKLAEMRAIFDSFDVVEQVINASQFGRGPAAAAG